MQSFAVRLTALLMYHHHCKVKAIQSHPICLLMTVLSQMLLGHHAALLASSEQHLVLQWL